jgi:signal transduction histidine kinase
MSDDPAWLLETVEEQARQLAEYEAETREFRSELDETNQGLLAVYAELKTANQRIADLVAMLSHDIRQPLSVINSYCRLLLDDWDELDDAQRRRDLDRISTASVGMTQLVEEILTLTQLDAEGLGTHPAPVNVADAVAEAVAGVAAAEPAMVSIGCDHDLWILVDPRHFHQIVTNLLSNALKYGTPPVDITTARGDELVGISVRDRGEGIPAAFLPHLFSRFARADTPATRTKKGTGLGLYIVRQLAEANHGEIRYCHHPDGGGCFTVRLQATAPPA